MKSQDNSTKSHASSSNDKIPNSKSTSQKEAIPSLKDKISFYESNPTMNDDYLFAASSCDCTGLTPTVAHNEAEAENYNEIAHYLPPIPPTGPIGAPEGPMNPPEGPITPAEGIHAEVNTLDKYTSEGNHIL